MSKLFMIEACITRTTVVFFRGAYCCCPYSHFMIGDHATD